ncbi:protein phosphatase 2C domain-containing protein [Kitasatospora sp. NPDC094028]
MILEFTHATAASPGAKANDDALVVGADFAIVLDGASAGSGETGCCHTVAWYSHQLAARLAALLTGGADLTLTEVLRRALTELVADHGTTCDMDNPDSPSSTVAIARVRAGVLEVLSLADSPIAVVRVDGTVRVVVDERTTRLPSYTEQARRELRNTDDGFWVASTRPEAADRAVTETLPLDQVTSFTLFSDGASRLAERYDWSWVDLLALLRTAKPSHVIKLTREAERNTDPARLGIGPGQLRGKKHDDATLVHCTVRPAATAGA